MATEDPASRSTHRPRTRSVLSFGSFKSGESGGRPKVNLTESARDKERHKMTTKADPTRAISEMQPGQAAYEKSTMESLRSLQHKDMQGNVITDPDASNPTRARLERPLDTIRSFEAAVDGSYRSTRPRPGTSYTGYDSRRSSVFQNFSSSTPQPRFPHPNGYGYGNGRMSRPESYVEGYGTGNTPPPFRDYAPRRLPPRNSSDPMLYGHNANGMYANHQHYQSHETATTGSGSGYSHGTATEPGAYSTDPSSENSSVDRIPQPPPKQQPQSDLGEQYGFSGFGGVPDLQQSPIMEEGAYNAPLPPPPPQHGRPAFGQNGYSNGYANGYNNGQNGYAGQNGYTGYNGQSGGAQNGYAAPQNGYGAVQNGQAQQQKEMPPPPPPHAGGMRPRMPSKLQSSKRTSQYDGYGVPERQESGEKRKSWLKRRFSRNV